MFQTRIHGRGGQGVVTAAELLSVAAFDAGLHAQAFPSFGSERTGAPVVAYCRISKRPIRNREPILSPDALIVQDATLLHQVDLLAGLPEDAYVLVNTRRSFDELGLSDFAATRDPARLVTVAATQIALRHIGKPVPNAVLLGGFAAIRRGRPVSEHRFDGREVTARRSLTRVVGTSTRLLRLIELRLETVTQLARLYQSLDPRLSEQLAKLSQLLKGSRATIFKSE